MTVPVKTKGEHVLLATVTGEPFQPARLYWSIPNRADVARVFGALRCMDEDEKARCWVWLYEAEAASLTFGKPRGLLPAEMHPIVIGRFRMPESNRLVMELRSFDRAIQAAKFFAARLGPKCVLRRARVINRWFEASEAVAPLDGLDRVLDSDVVRIDPADAEKAIAKVLAGARTQEEKVAALARYDEERRRQDVPLVEDFPLAPEEQTPDFRDLALTLSFREIRAAEHWKGNTSVTLADVIHRMVKDGRPGGRAPRSR